jgi:plastocyanin
MRRTIPALALSAVVVLALSACGDDGGGTTTSDTGSSSDEPVTLEAPLNNEGTQDIGDATTLELEADDDYFDPTFTKAAAGAEITVTIDNEGEKTHTFTIDDQDIDVEVAPGDTAEATVTIPDGDALRYYCRLHQSQGMQGAFYSADGQTVIGVSSTSTDSGSPGGYGY